MKNVIKGAVITLGILVVLIIVNVLCNKAGHELNSLYTGVITPIIAMAIYDKLTGNPSNKKA